MSIPGIDEIKSAFKEILSVLNMLKELGLKAGKFFENLAMWTLDFAKAMKFMGNVRNSMAILLTVTIPVIGQLIARFMILGGSMDKPWLFLFAIPPLTLVPAIAMIFNIIESSEGSPPWDNIVWLPLIANTIGTLLAKENKIRNIIKFGLTIGGFMIAYWYKSTILCTKEGQAKTSKIALDSLISYMFTIVLAIVLPFIPIIGRFFSILQSILPHSDLFFQAFAIFLVYVSINISNSAIPGQCGVSIKDEDIYKTMLAAMLLTAVIAFSPGDATTMLKSMQSKMKNYMINQ